MFSSNLVISDAKNLYLAIFAEKDDLVSKRAKVDIKLVGNDVEISISADDFTSFRAMESAVMRLLVTYYKIEKVQ